MRIQCDCGKFQAEISPFPRDSAGHCVCYCDDCQTYAEYLGRADVLTPEGGTDIVPVHPDNILFLSGREQLRLVRLSEKGTWRFYAQCCRTPLVNSPPGLAWAGVLVHSFRGDVGPVVARINGKWAKGGCPRGASQKIGLRDLRPIAWFMLKGSVLRRWKKSPFYEADHQTPITPPVILSAEDRDRLRAKRGFESSKD